MEPLLCNSGHIRYAYRLVCFISTGITGVSGHHHHRFDFSGSGHNPFHLHKLSNAVCFNFPDQLMFLVTRCLEI